MDWDLRSWQTGVRIAIWGGLVLMAQNPYREAQRLTQKRQWEAAVRAWQRILPAEEDSGRRALVYQQLGYIALMRGDSAEALMLWKQSLQYRPAYRVAWENYIWLRQRLRVPPPLDPLRYAQYIPLPPPTESAPPTWGSAPPTLNKPLRWLSAERLAR